MSDTGFIASLPAPPRRNVELKAHDPRPERTLAACLKLPAKDAGRIWQRDTYFPVAHGKLKLREQQPGRAQLIHYNRETRARERESRYTIAEIDSPEALCTALAGALGTQVVVTKHRRLLLWRSVRIHLDEVEDLGSFIELEAVAQADSDLQLEYQLIARLRASLEITDDRLIAGGYADQLLNTVAP